MRRSVCEDHSCAESTNYVVPAAEWMRERDAHRARILAVIDFLFTYYAHRPGQLLRWHPGFGIVLAGADEYATYRGYAHCGHGITADPAFLDRRRDTIEHIAGLLQATAGRPAQLSCFGLHEWAMVYRSGDVRHSRVPLRLGRDGTEEVVEALALRCTHYDAYRSTQLDREQPGCLHAAMDLYKFCSKMEPLIESGLIASCFELAHRARELDMRASPYDLSEFGYSPIRIETPPGRAEYVRMQTVIAGNAAELRAGLLRRCQALLNRRAGAAGRQLRVGGIPAGKLSSLPTREER